MNRLLSYLGLMKIAEHEDAHSDLKRRVGEAETASSDWEAKFKKAITDLEGEIRDRKKAQYDLALARLEVEALRPGHEANERRLKRDREQKAAKRAASR